MNTEAHAAWRGSDIQHDESWKYKQTPDDVNELIAAERHARSTGKPMAAWQKDDFPLPRLAANIRNWMTELDRGRGFILLKGFPVAAHDEATCAHVYWGLGLHMGRAISQNTDGDLLGHVRDTGADPKAHGVRLYKTRAEQDFHTDGADIIGLFCLQPAKAGGVSRIVSSVAVYEEIRRRAPEAAAVLFHPFPFDTQNQQKPGQEAWFEMPICRQDGEGRVSMFFIPWYIRESQTHADAPRLSALQSRAIAAIEEIANDPRLYLDMQFERGDMQFLKNATILHKRTEYEDYDEPARKRHLLRLWLVEPAFSGGHEGLRRGIA
jgi:hypothetical protein